MTDGLESRKLLPDRPVEGKESNSRSAGIAAVLHKIADMDRAVAFAVLGNLASLVCGPVTALLIALYFSPELQGFYYTIGSLTSLQFLMDMGFSQTILLFASHEGAGLGLSRRGRITGAGNPLSRFIHLGKMAFRWYGSMASVLVIGLAVGGCLLFSRSTAEEIRWTWPWLTICLGVGVNFCLLPVWSLLQGCNQVAEYWFYRWIQQVVNAISLWLAVLLGTGLWASAWATGAGLAWTGLFLWGKYPEFCPSFATNVPGPRLRWREDVWPVQWRIAVTWFSGTFTTQLFVPLLFYLSGPALAGQMGMTATLGSVLSALASNWVVTRGPRMGVLIAQGQYGELDATFFRAFTAAVGVICAGATGTWGLICLLYTVENPLGLRILPPLPSGLFLLAMVFSTVNVCLATYLRAYKKEPLAAVSFIATVLTFGLAAVLGRYFGATGVCAAYLGVLACIQFPLSVWIFAYCRAAWHLEASADPSEPVDSSAV